MRNRLRTSLCTLGASWSLVSGGAFAQDASAGISASSAGVETSAAATGPAVAAPAVAAPAVEGPAVAGPAVEAPAPAPVAAPVVPATPEMAPPPPAPIPDFNPEPIPHPVELGLYFGALFPPEDHALQDPNRAKQRYESVAPEFGLRATWLPIPYIGIEGEGMMAPSSDTDGGAANLFALRLHGILQVPTPYLTPFVAIGGGTFWVDGEKLGEDSDNSFTLGLGVKIPLNDTLRARIDLRDNMMAKQTAGDIPDWYEVLFGLTWGFGGTKPLPPPAPPVDSDGDGLTDDIDQCPVAPANTPDGCPIPDTDNDGVLDNLDECPQEPGTLPNGCPDLDPDKDGVPLPADQCPDVVGIDPDGCPDPDPDKDGIPVPADQCPDQPETVNGYEDADGCPDEIPEVVKKFTGVIKGIQFDFGKSTIRPQSFKLLNEAAAVLTEHQSLRLEISGHTDSVGSRERNLALSQARAESVKEYLVAQGIDASRLITRGAGPDEPVADNATKAGQAENRRIEFKMLQ